MTEYKAIPPRLLSGVLTLLILACGSGPVEEPVTVTATDQPTPIPTATATEKVVTMPQDEELGLTNHWYVWGLHRAYMSERDWKNGGYKEAGWKLLPNQDPY